MEDLQAIRDAAYAMRASHSFPEIALATIRLDRLLGTRDPAQLDASEREWTRLHAETQGFHDGVTARLAALAPARLAPPPVIALPPQGALL